MQLLQARSIAKYFARDCLGQVLYVWNDASAAPKGLHAELAACLGDVRFRFVYADSLGIESSAIEVDGWTTQQAAKLLAARRIDADHYLVLDAKNHFIWPCVVTDFLAEDGRAVAPIERIGSTAAFRYSVNYFHIDGDTADDRGVLDVTPFVFRTDVVRRLLVALEQKDGSVVTAFLAHQNKLMEFMSYQAYARARAPTPRSCSSPLAHAYQRRFRLRAFAIKRSSIAACTDHMCRDEGVRVALDGVLPVIGGAADNSVRALDRARLDGIRGVENAIALVRDGLTSGDRRFPLNLRVAAHSIEVAAPRTSA